LQIEPGWLFRVASAKRWGGGHVARCRSLATAVRHRRPVTFVLDDDDGGWSKPLAENGFAVWTGEGWPAGRWCGTLMDGYGFSDADALSLREVAAPLVVLDDLMSPPPTADLIVNPGAESLKYAAPALQGPRYALIDRKYLGLPPPPIREQVEHLVITFGRYDTLGATELALRALTLLGDRDGLKPRLSVVLGADSPNLRDTRMYVEALGEKAQLLVDHRDMPGLLASADMVIGAGGVSLYERLACGVPSVTLCVAPNQALNIAVCERHGATTNGGPIEAQTTDGLADTVLSLACNWTAREDQSRSGQACVDGHGPQRVADAMMRLAQTRSSLVASH